VVQLSGEWRKLRQEEFHYSDLFI